MLQNDIKYTSNMFKNIILSRIEADRYQKFIFKIILLSPPLPPLLENCALTQIASKNVVKSEQIVKVFLIYMTLSQGLKLFKVCFCGVLWVYPLLEISLHTVDFLKNKIKSKNHNQFLFHIGTRPLLFFRTYQRVNSGPLIKVFLHKKSQF